MTIQNTTTTEIAALEKQLAEKKREARLADEPLGPERPTTLADAKAFYDAIGGVEEGDRLVWSDGRVDEVRGTVSTQRLNEPEMEPEGEIIHTRVVRQGESVVDVGEAVHFRDYWVGEVLAGMSRSGLTVTVRSADGHGMDD